MPEHLTEETPLEFWSTFSGVGGIDLGLERAGMRCTLQAESDEWCRAVLAARFPGVPCLNDVRDVAQGAEGARPDGRRAVGGGGAHGHPDGSRSGPASGRAGRIDLLCGGFPCQDVSVAGRRAGLAGERSGLFHEFARIAAAVRPTWLLIENVPGLLTSNGGRDFGVVVGELAEIGYGVAWRVLDSRYFGVPQRRRRIFIVGHIGGDDGPALRAICESCDGRAAPRETTWQAAAARAGNGAQADRDYYVEDGRNGTLKAGGAGGSPPRTDRLPLLVSPTLKSAAGGGGNYGPEMPMVAGALTSTTGQLDDADTNRLVAATLSARSAAGRTPGRSMEDDVNLVPSAAYALQPDDKGTSRGALRGVPIDAAPTIGRGDHHSDRGARVANASSVRRLTPRECERLQGFPDDWTLIDGLACPDSRRYGAMGNAVTVNVAEWLGLGIVAEHARVGGAVGPSASWA